MSMFGALSVSGRRIKGMIRLRPEQVWTCNVTRHHRPLLSPSGSRNEMGTPRCRAYRVLLSHVARDESSGRNSVSCQSQSYSVAVRGNVNSRVPTLTGTVLIRNLILSLVTKMWLRDLKWQERVYEVLYQRCGNAGVNDVGYIHICVVFLYVKMCAEKYGC
jgi:hypothetical protein